MLGIILAVRLLKRERYEGLFAKLNSGATNSVGGTSERSIFWRYHTLSVPLDSRCSFIQVVCLLFTAVVFLVISN